METLLWLEKYMSEAEEMIMDGQVDEGMLLLHDMLYDEPGYASLHNSLGWAYMYYVKDEARAEMHFKFAIRFAQDFAPPYLHLGRLYHGQARYSEAVATFRDGLSKKDAIRSALLEGMAHAYEMTRMYRWAIRAYKEAAAATVGDAEVQRMLTGVKRCRRKSVVLFFTF